jgi:tryptophan synthase alpha chain
LARGFKVDEAFEVAASARRQVPIALIAMVSFSVVRRMGDARFVRRALDCGFDGLIVPDLPYEEAGDLSTVAARDGLRHIMLVAAGTPPDRAQRIAQMSTGFVYQVSAHGLTGERGQLPVDLRERVTGLRKAARKPVCVGFGVSSAAHVREVCAVADGVIVGSAIIRRISEGLDAGRPAAAIVDEVSAFVDELAAGTV